MFGGEVWTIRSQSRPDKARQSKVLLTRRSGDGDGDGREMESLCQRGRGAPLDWRSWIPP